MRRSEFLKSQMILRLATIDSSEHPHIVPVWYKYINGKFYVGTNTKTKKAKNIRENSKVSFCVDAGIRSPDIYGVMGTGRAMLILKRARVQSLAKQILCRYFKSLKNESAQELLNETDCIIEITPRTISSWQY